MTAGALPLPLPDPALADGDLELRAWSPGDEEVLVAAWADPDIARWTGAPEDTSIVAARRWIRGEAERRLRGLALDLVVTVDDEIVGEVGLCRFDRVRAAAEIGWWTAAGHRGRGYAGRAVRLVSSWAVSELCVDRVYARVDAANGASVAVARRAGLEPRGTASDGLEVWVGSLHPARAGRPGATVHL